MPNSNQMLGKSSGDTPDFLLIKDKTIIISDVIFEKDKIKTLKDFNSLIEAIMRWEEEEVNITG